MSVRHTWIERGEHALLARIDEPADRSAVGVLVVVPSVAREAVVSSRAVRVLAIRAAEVGFAAVTFSLSGNGDSGVLRDTWDLGATWRGDVEAVVDFARTLAPGLPVHVIGLRLGATLLDAAPAQPGEQRIAWEPVDGAGFIRHHKTIRRMSLRIPVTADGVELSGFALSDAQAEAVRTLRAARPGDTSSVIVRRETDRDAATKIALASPHFAQVPTEAIADIVASLPVAEPRPLADWAPTETVTSERDGTRLTETLVQVGPHGLSGVLTTPESFGNGSPVPGVLLSAMGAEVRSGPGDLWPSLAARLAARGVVTLRVDRRGLGESLDPDRVNEPRPYTDAATTDTAESALYLKELVQGPVTAVGVCAGVWLALRAAPEAEGAVDRIVAVNGLHWHPREERYTEEFYDQFFRQGTEFADIISSDDDEPDPLGERNGAPGSTSRPDDEEATKSRVAWLHGHFFDLRHAVATRFPKLRAWFRSDDISDRVGWLLKDLDSTSEVLFVMGRWERARFRAQGGDDDLRAAERRGLAVRAVQRDDLDHSLLSSTARAAISDVIVEEATKP